MRFVYGILFFYSAVSFAGLPTKISNVDLTASTKGTVVVFVSARCPCSQSHEPALKSLYQQYSKSGFQFVAVHSNADESREESQKHFKEAGLPFHVVEDPKQELADTFGALKTPHVFIVNSKREILFQGGVDDSAEYADAKKHYLREALEALDKGKEVPQAKARALGCMIRRG